MRLSPTSFRALLLLAGVAAALPPASAAAEPSLRAAAGSAPPAKAVIIGIDAASWNVLGPLIDRGALPNLARLAKRGSSGDLASFWPLRTPQVWTSIVTGKLPGQHRIWDHLSSTRYNPPPFRTVQQRRLTTRHRRSKAIWQILSDHGLRTFSVGWIASWPAERLPGATIVAPVVSLRPGRLTTIKGTLLRDEGGQVSPRRLWPAVRDRIVKPSEVSAKELAFYGDIPPPGSPLRLLPKIRSNLKALRWSTAREESVERVTLGLYDEAQPDLLLVYFQCGDSLAHRFWIFQKEQALIERRLKRHQIRPRYAEELKRRFGGVVEACWRDQDARIGRILARASDERTLVMVISDHGFGDAPEPHTDDAEPYGGNHLDNGLIIAAGPHVRRGGNLQGVTALDVTPTLLHYLGLEVAQDMRGKPAAALFEESWWRDHPPRTRATYERKPQLRVPYADGYPSRANRPYATSR